MNSESKSDTTPEAVVAERYPEQPEHPIRPPYGYICYRASGPIEIDGKMDEESWENAPWTNYFADIEGDVRPAPRYKTRVKMLWDDEYFYIAAEMEEPHVWGTLTKRDSIIYMDNDFEVFIDPDGDTHLYYEIEINVLNTVWDLFLVKPYRDGAPAIYNWDINGLKHAVHVDGTLNDSSDVDKGWTVEFAIPWAVLRECAYMRTPPGEGDQWRVNFSRVEWDHEIVDSKYEKVKNRLSNDQTWTPQYARNIHQPERWGYVQFTDIQAGKGEAEFVRDPDEPVRDYLMEVYYAQKRYFKANKRWAASLDDLNFKESMSMDNPTPPNGAPVKLQTTDVGFAASMDSVCKPVVWFVNEVSRLWKVGK
ncbi:MAG: carbohydrate-binding family 9-like protein [Armatimonadota bacterium]